MPFYVFVLIMVYLTVGQLFFAVLHDTHVEVGGRFRFKEDWLMPAACILFWIVMLPYAVIHMKRGR